MRMKSLLWQRKQQVLGDEDSTQIKHVLSGIWGSFFSFLSGSVFVKDLS